MDNSAFKDIAPFLQHPLVLIGFAIMLFFGMVTALLKAGVLPSLPKKTTADLLKRVINLGFVISLLIILLGFWLFYSKRDHVEANRNDSSGQKHDRTTTGGSRHAEYCRVTLFIPAELNDARVLVDGKPADIIERKPTFLIVRMEKRSKSQRILLDNGFRQCSTDAVIDGDKELKPCL
ncbi:MAG: hypothetical protein HW412_1995 [Bacteroidetes bacterium]|nr:hypothetical protein [Bacteroidota bacterium]